MKLSALQKFILKQCLAEPNHSVTKRGIEAFYANTKVKPKNIVNDITKSVERLITKDLAAGYGKRTSHKWYIHKVELTAQGRRFTRELFGKQQQLPFKTIKKSHS